MTDEATNCCKYILGRTEYPWKTFPGISLNQNEISDNRDWYLPFHHSAALAGWEGKSSAVTQIFRLFAEGTQNVGHVQLCCKAPDSVRKEALHDS